MGNLGGDDERDELLEPQPLSRPGASPVPPGQYVTTSWPVVDLGIKPQVPKEAWVLAVDGEVEEPLRIGWTELLAMPQVTEVSDFHCVAGWSRLDMPWTGVRLAAVLLQARLTDAALVLMCHGYDGYTTNVPLAEALASEVLLAHTIDGCPLSSEHGGPVRMITPQLYAWKGTKWIRRIEVLAQDRPGYWERRGYSNTAHPWRNDRYA